MKRFLGGLLAIGIGFIPSSVFAQSPSGQPPAGWISIGQGAALPLWKAITGDISIALSGVATIAANAVTNAKSAQMAAVTLKGNPTNALANATDFTIGGLTANTSPDAVNDYLLMWNHTMGTFQKINPGTIASSAAAGVASLGGATGALTLGSGLSIPGGALTNTGVLSIGSTAGAITLGAGLTIPGAVLTYTPTAPGSSGQFSYNSSGSPAGSSVLTLSGSNVVINGTVNPLQITGSSSTAVSFELINSVSGGHTWSVGSAGAGISAGLGSFYIFDGTASGNNTRALIDASGNTQLFAYQGVADIRLFGSPTCNNGSSTGVDTAMASAISAGYKRIFLAATCWTNNSGNVVFANGVEIIIQCGAQISPAGGVTVTIKGAVSIASSCATPAFGGGGTVTGIGSVLPEWWGASFGGSAATNTAAINAAIASVQGSSGSDGTQKSIQFACGTYAINATVTFTVSTAIPWRIKGCGAVGNAPTTLLTVASFSGSIGILITSSGTAIADWSLTGLAVLNQTAGSGPTAGIQIGSSGNNLIGTQSSLVEDVYASGFSLDWLIEDVRLITFRRVSGWSTDSTGTTETVGSAPFTIGTTSGATTFTGDMDFYNSQCVAPLGSGTPTGTCFNVNNAVNGTSIAGVRLHSFIFYGGATQFNWSVSNGGTIGDLWIDGGSQFEGPAPGTSAGIASINNASTAYDFHLDHAYMSGSGFNKQVAFTTPSGGVTHNILLTNNFLANPVHESIDLRGTGGAMRGVTVTGNQINDPGGNSNAAIYIETVTGATINGNSVTGTLGTRPEIILFNGGGNFYTAIGNNGGGLVSATIINSSTAANVCYNTTNCPNLNQ